MDEEAARDKESFCRCGSGLSEKDGVDKAATSSKDGWAFERSGFLHNEIDRAISKCVSSCFSPRPSPRTAKACVISLRDTHQSARAALIRPLRAESHGDPIGLGLRSFQASQDVRTVTCYICIDFGSNDNQIGCRQASRVGLKYTVASEIRDLWRFKIC